MSKNQEINHMANNIIQVHDGKFFFNFREASKIIGCGRNTFANLLHNQGILVRKVGPSKLVSAYDIASVMCSDRVAPID